MVIDLDPTDDPSQPPQGNNNASGQPHSSSVTVVTVDRSLSHDDQVKSLCDLLNQFSHCAQINPVIFNTGMSFRDVVRGIVEILRRAYERVNARNTVACHLIHYSYAVSLGYMSLIPARMLRFNYDEDDAQLARSVLQNLETKDTSRMDQSEIITEITLRMAAILAAAFPEVKFECGIHALYFAPIF